MISRRRFLAGAITGTTLLMIPREILGTTGPAAASATAAESAPVAPGAGVSRGAPAEPTLTPDPASSSPSTPPTDETGETGETAGSSAVTVDARYQVVIESIRYRDQIGTVYRPEVTAAHPVVYFLHGGYWDSGSRHQYDREAQIWAEHGWVGVTMDYTLNADYQVMMRDVHAGLSFVQSQWYADPSRQILFGDSAGGYLAAMAGAEQPKRFKGQILWSPVISPLHAYQDGNQAFAALGHLSRSARRVAGGDWTGADVSELATRTSPPLWIAASSQEFVYFPRQGQLLVDALGASRCDVHLVAGERHGKSLQQGALMRSARAWARDQVESNRSA